MKSRTSNITAMAEIIADLKSQPTVPLWPHAAMLRGVGKNAIYSAAKNGELAVVKTGRRTTAISAVLRRELCLDEAAAAS